MWILSVFLIWDTSQHTRLEICNLDFWYRIPDSPACIVGEIMGGSSYLLAIRRTSAVDMWLGYRALLGKWFVLWTPSLKHSMAPAKLVVKRWNVFGMAYNFQRRPVSSRAGNEFHRIWTKKVIGNDGVGKWKRTVFFTTENQNHGVEENDIFWQNAWSFRRSPFSTEETYPPWAVSDSLPTGVNLLSTATVDSNENMRLGSFGNEDWYIFC